VHLGHWYAQLVPYRRGFGWQDWPYHPVGDPFYADLADFHVEVTVPEGYSVFGGGELRREGERWIFDLQAGRDFAAFAGRNYAESEGQSGGVRVISVYRREHAEAGLAALEIAEQAMAVYQGRYGPYPYDTFTVFEGDLYGGMEYSGIVSVGAVFYRDYGGTAQEVLPALVAHELAHQWWYGVVGNDQVHAPWLDEALARYSEVLFYEAVYPEAVDWWWEARVNAWAPAGHIDVEIYDFSDTASYVHHLYPRASQFMHELRLRVGDEAFSRFLQRYYRENAYKRVGRLDFFLLLREETSIGLEDLIATYFGH
jgi:aminopeptidase N